MPTTAPAGTPSSLLDAGVGLGEAAAIQNRLLLLLLQALQKL
jgi:hypothetical protein